MSSKISCCVCLSTPTADQQYYLLDSDLNPLGSGLNDLTLREKFMFCVPEFRQVLNNAENIWLCNICSSALCLGYYFRKLCLDVKTKIVDEVIIKSESDDTDCFVKCEHNVFENHEAKFAEILTNDLLIMKKACKTIPELKKYNITPKQLDCYVKIERLTNKHSDMHEKQMSEPAVILLPKNIQSKEFAVEIKKPQSDEHVKQNHSVVDAFARLLGDNSAPSQKNDHVTEIFGNYIDFNKMNQEKDERNNKSKQKVDKPKRSRGRPKKQLPFFMRQRKLAAVENVLVIEENDEQQKPKKKGGRPKKRKLPQHFQRKPLICDKNPELTTILSVNKINSVENEKSLEIKSLETPQQPKRKRGRPRKEVKEQQKFDHYEL